MTALISDPVLEEFLWGACGIIFGCVLVILWFWWST